MAWKWEVAINNTNVIRVIDCELRQHGRKLGTIWSLKVTVFNESHRGGIRTFDPIIIFNAKYFCEFSRYIRLVTDQRTFHLKAGNRHNPA